MKVSIVISIKNRAKLFKRTLKQYNKQTMPKTDWELIIVDDNSSDDILSILKEHAAKINFQYVKIDSGLIGFPIYWGPALSNNVGFKTAAGEVICITGPEILMDEVALEYAYESAMKNQTVYAHVLHSSQQFILLMDQNPAMEEYSFKRLFSLPSSKVQDITKNTFYWFFCAAKKEHIMAINGCDEEFMKGICGDDDDFSNRMHELGAHKAHDFRIVGIHQDHKVEDSADPKRIRWNPTWEVARLRNTKYLEEWFTIRNRKIIANENYDWGSEKTVLSRYIHRA